MADEQTFDPAVLTKAAEDTFTVRRVFGEPNTVGGVTVIPVARVLGMVGTGAGHGEGAGTSPWLRGFGPGRFRHDEPAAPDEPAGSSGPTEPTGPDAHGAGHGGAGMYSAWVQPLGVVVVDGTGARWRPTFDANLAIAAASLAFTAVASACALARALRRH